MGRRMVPPDASWRPELKGTIRAWNWQRAAGINKDGSTKTRMEHRSERVRVNRKAKLKEINDKDVDDRTPEDKEYLEKEAANREHIKKKRDTPANREHIKKQRATPVNKAKASEYNQKRRNIPANKAKQAGYAKKRQIKIHAEKVAGVQKFSDETGCGTGDEPLTNEDAFMSVRRLMDDKDSPTGQAIVEVLGMTLGNALWDGKGNSSIYALAGRGDGAVGGSQAEWINFLVKRKDPVLTNGASKKHFTSTQQNFKDLGLHYIPIYKTKSYANCTTFESAFQLAFDFLPIGRRLWKQSGAGNFKRQLRTKDMNYITRTGDLNPEFMFGITILPNVSVTEQVVNADGEDIIKSISAGNGVHCDVTQAIYTNPIMTDEQEAARAAMYATLPPHYCAGC
jgi:hypothetical protein